jgi:MotA/TolQ/ExbB proton channel family
MSQIWNQVGFIRWPLAFSTLAIFALTAWSAVKLFGPGAWADLRTKAFVDATLFWGGFAAISGMLGTLVGIVIASQAIEAAGAVSTTLVWGGIKVAMLSSMFGMLILGMSALAWFGLQLRWRLLEADAAQG